MIKKNLLLVVAALSIVAHPASLIAFDSSMVSQETVQDDIQLSNEEIVIRLVDKFSKQYGVDGADMMRTLRNENHTFQFDKQSELKYKQGNRWGFPVGTREKSYGICQIHLPDNPEITYEQAIDPEYCVEFMAKKFAQGKQRMWMGYSK